MMIGQEASTLEHLKSLVKLHVIRTVADTNQPCSIHFLT